MSTLADATDADKVMLLNYAEDYRATKQRALVALEEADVLAIVQRARAEVDARYLLFPDADALLERAVVALLGGHVVLSGPPGTGKTTLAEILSRAFRCTWETVTATADWTAFDVIGGLQPSIVGTGDAATEVLKPRLGNVPRAAVECANVIARHADDSTANPDQAHWLILDEFNRAEVDKAIGPLYTALGGGTRRLPLWFGDVPERMEVWLPERFRIVATLNSVDTAYVFTFSQGLTRRFQFIYVGVPEESQVGVELEAAMTQAARWFAATYGGPTADGDAAVQEFLADKRVQQAKEMFEKVIRFVRYGSEGRPGWPLGTAQVVDTFRQLAIRRTYASSSDDGLVKALDLAIADRIVPQMDQLLRDQITGLEDRLKESDLAPLERSRRALTQLRETQSTAFS